jgi:hypothetical protein
MNSRQILPGLVALWLSLPALCQAPASPDELIKQVLTALESKDQDALKQLTVTKAEFKKYLWPNIASRVVGDGMNSEKYYSMYEKTSQVGLTDRLAEFGGHKWQLVKVSFGGDTKQSKGFRVLSHPEVNVRDDRGQEQTMYIAAAVLEHDGTCKVTSFYVRPPQAAQK